MTNREIDVLVAEHCMECAACICDHRKTIAPRFDSDTGACLSCGKRLLRHYTTDPVASKALRDKMRTDGWWYTMRLSIMHDPPTYECVFYGLMRGFADYVATTEELAIAIAALKAKGVNVE